MQRQVFIRKEHTGAAANDPGGESHMKVTGMLVVSLRGINFGFLVSLRVFREKRQYF